MYGEGAIKEKSADGLTQQGCPYSGYSVFAGEFVPEKESDFADYFECGYKVYIGPGKYFVTSDVGAGRVREEGGAEGGGDADEDEHTEARSALLVL